MTFAISDNDFLIWFLEKSNLSLSRFLNLSNSLAIACIPVS